MVVHVLEDKNALGNEAGKYAASVLREIIRKKGKARIIAATGASQFEFLEVLTKEPGIDWSKVEMFHLDEYVGMPITHPASFRKYLMERLIQKTGITNHHLLDVEKDVRGTIQRVSEALKAETVDLAFVGIGENGHLAFNDPPADFQVEDPYIIVELDEACRMQQVGEGWFKSMEEVPKQAASMSVKQILKAKEIIAIVPDARKAKAVKACLEGEISPLAPASILKNHPSTSIYLDKNSASLLTRAAGTAK